MFGPKGLQALMLIEVPKKIPGPQYSIAAAIRNSMGRIRKPFDRIRQTKTFLIAKMNGADTKEATRLASLPGSPSLTTTMYAPLTQAILQEMCKYEEMQDKGIAKRLKEMWNHKRVRLQKVGDDVHHVEEDDTDMWKFSMDKVLRLKGYVKDRSADEPGGEGGEILATNGITFNILQVPNEEKTAKP